MFSEVFDGRSAFCLEPRAAAGTAFARADFAVARFHPRTVFHRLVFFIALLSLSVLSPLWSTAATLEWDRNSESIVVGYRAFYGTASRGYDVEIDVGNNTFAVITNLTVGVTYYFAVKAYTATGVESDFSQEISYTVPNSAPIARPDTYSVAKAAVLTLNPAIGVLQNDTDANGDELSAVLVTTTANGSLSLGLDGGFVYVPNSAFVGADSFLYRATDGKATSSVVTVTINVTAPPNTAPLAQADRFTTVKATALTVPAANGVLKNDTDIDGDTLSAVLVSSPVNGSVNLEANGGFTYVPSATFVGIDSFSYRASDGKAASSAALVTITVASSLNGAPSALADSYATLKGTTLVVGAANGLLKNDTDPDGDQLIAQLSVAPDGGVLRLDPDGSFTYSPKPTFHGIDTFTYRATDGKTTSGVASVSIAVTATPNSVPVSMADSYTTVRGAALTVSADDGLLKNDTDAEASALTAIPVRNPENGSLNLSASGGFTYTPRAAFMGIDSFTYCASDGQATSSVAAVTITVTGPTNESPAAQSEAYTTPKQTRLTVPAQSGVLTNDSDANGDALIAILEAEAAHGTVTLDPDGGFTYLPEPAFVGVDSFTYSVYDGQDLSPAESVIITVNDVAGPVSRSDSYRTINRATLQIPAEYGLLANDVVPEGATPSALLVSPTIHGELEFRGDGSFSYTSEPSFAGFDSFTYLVTDGSSTSAVASVDIKVEISRTAPCVDCYADLDNFLIANPTVFPGVARARLTMPTNGPCIDAGLKTIGAVTRAARRSKDPELLAAMEAAGECLLGSATAKVEEQKALQQSMLPSKWMKSASNQIAKSEKLLKSANTAADVYLRARMLASLAKMISRTDKLIATGSVAPESLSGRTMQFHFTLAGQHMTQTFQLDGSTFSARDLNGDIVATGAFDYQRDTWNQGTLILFYDGAPSTDTVAITFSSTRWRLVGQQLRGYAVPE